MSGKKSTEIIDLSAAALEGIKSRLALSSLQEEDKSVLLAIVSAYVWIQSQLTAAKLTIHRLKKMFGFSTEKRKKTSEQRQQTDLVLDLNSLKNLESPYGSLNALQSLSKEPPTKK
jgi:hypothetical protein